MPVIVEEDRRNSDHFEALFNYATIGILITDSRGRIASINSFACKEFGYDKEELIDRKIETLIPRRYHTKHEMHRNIYSESPHARPMGSGLDLYALRKDGTEFPIEVSLGNYIDSGESYAAVFISNISGRKKAESDINRLNEELESTVEQRTKELTNTLHQLEYSKEELSNALEREKELSELKSRFVSMASHEFRTPLSTVLSSSYLIGKYLVNEDYQKIEKHLERIVSSANMLTGILNDFLSLGKIEEGKIQVRPIECKIEDLISSIIVEMTPGLKDQQKILYQHEGEAVATLDATLFRHIIQNLISNASKFSPETIPIEIKSFIHSNVLSLSVKDYGIGISKEDQKHLMERFFRGSNVANIQGTGLGLHIIAKYAELMNGVVECKSELDRGTEFLVKFKLNDN